MKSWILGKNRRNFGLHMFASVNVESLLCQIAIDGSMSKHTKQFFVFFLRKFSYRLFVCKLNMCFAQECIFGWNFTYLRRDIFLKYGLVLIKSKITCVTFYIFSYYKIFTKNDGNHKILYYKFFHSTGACKFYIYYPKPYTYIYAVKIFQFICQKIMKQNKRE